MRQILVCAKLSSKLTFVASSVGQCGRYETRNQRRVVNYCCVNLFDDQAGTAASNAQTHRRGGALGYKVVRCCKML